MAKTAQDYLALLGRIYPADYLDSMKPPRLYLTMLAGGTGTYAADDLVTNGSGWQWRVWTWQASTRQLVVVPAASTQQYVAGSVITGPSGVWTVGSVDAYFESGPGYEIYQAYARQMARVSLAGERTFESMYLHGRTHASTEMASGGKKSAGLLTISRTPHVANDPKVVLYSGTRFGTHVDVDMPEGWTDRKVVNEYALLSDVTFMPGDTGPFTAMAESVKTGWQQDVLALAIDTPSKPIDDVTPSMLLMVAGAAGTYLTNEYIVGATSGARFRVYSYDTGNANTGVLVALAGSPFASGVNPYSVAVDPTGTFLYTANSGDDTFSGYTITPVTGALVPIAGSPFALAAGSTPVGIAVDPTGAFLYIANIGPNNISAYTITPVTGVPVPVVGSPFAGGNDPAYVATDPAGKFLFVANISGNNVSAYTIAAGTGILAPVAGSPFATGLGPYGVAVNPTGGFLYVANGGAASVSGYAVNPVSGVLTPIVGSPFAVGAAPHAIAINSAGTFAYVANFGDNTVTVYAIDPATGALSASGIGPFATGAGPFDVRLSVTGKTAYVANSGAATVSAYVVNASTGALTAAAGSPFAAGASPHSIAADPLDRFVYVANEVGNTVSGYEMAPYHEIVAIPEDRIAPIVGEAYVGATSGFTQTLIIAYRYLDEFNLPPTTGATGLTVFNAAATTGGRYPSLDAVGYERGMPRQSAEPERETLLMEVLGFSDYTVGEIVNGQTRRMRMAAGTGDYVLGETAVGGMSGASWRVVAWDPLLNDLTVASRVWPPVDMKLDETVTGTTSTTARKILSMDSAVSQAWKVSAWDNLTRVLSLDATIPTPRFVSGSVIFGHASAAAWVEASSVSYTPGQPEDDEEYRDRLTQMLDCVSKPGILRSIVRQLVPLGYHSALLVEEPDIGCFYTVTGDASYRRHYVGAGAGAYVAGEYIASASGNAWQVVTWSAPVSVLDLAPRIVDRIVVAAGGGAYVVGEIVVGSSSGARASVLDWNGGTNTLTTVDTNGRFFIPSLVELQLVPGAGNYIVGEIVIGSPSQSTGEVLYWDPAVDLLEVKPLQGGPFLAADTIYGRSCTRAMLAGPTTRGEQVTGLTSGTVREFTSNTYIQPNPIADGDTVLAPVSGASYVIDHQDPPVASANDVRACIWWDDLDVGTPTGAAHWYVYARYTPLKTLAFYPVGDRLTYPRQYGMGYDLTGSVLLSTAEMRGAFCIVLPDITPPNDYVYPAIYWNVVALKAGGVLFAAMYRDASLNPVVAFPVPILPIVLLPMLP